MEFATNTEIGFGSQVLKLLLKQSQEKDDSFEARQAAHPTANISPMKRPAGTDVAPDRTTKRRAPRQAAEDVPSTAASSGSNPNPAGVPRILSPPGPGPAAPKAIQPMGFVFDDVDFHTECF